MFPSASADLESTLPSASQSRALGVVERSVMDLRCLERLARADQPAQQKLESLYWTALSRPPTATELEAGLQHLTKAETTEAKRGRLEDIAWALMNSKEFILRR